MSNQDCAIACVQEGDQRPLLSFVSPGCIKMGRLLMTWKGFVRAQTTLIEIKPHRWDGTFFGQRRRAAFYQKEEAINYVPCGQPLARPTLKRARGL